MVPIKILHIMIMTVFMVLRDQTQILKIDIQSKIYNNLINMHNNSEVCKMITHTLLMLTITIHKLTIQLLLFIETNLTTIMQDGVITHLMLPSITITMVGDGTTGILLTVEWVGVGVGTHGKDLAGAGDGTLGTVLVGAGADIMALAGAGMATMAQDGVGMAIMDLDGAMAMATMAEM